LPKETAIAVDTCPNSSRGYETLHEAAGLASAS
jgi:hypothetical protein